MHRLKGLYGVTDSQLQPDDHTLLSTVEQALLGGMKLLQYRDKSEDHDKRLRQAGALKVLCHRYQAILLINDDIELALTVEADGVHLGQKDESVAKARERLGQYAIIGATCEGSLTLAEQAIEQGANYIAFGRFYPSKTTPDANPADMAILSQAKQRFNVPIVAIGGITVDNTSHLVEAGADMVAVVNQLFAAQEVKSRAQQFIQAYQHCITLSS